MIARRFGAARHGGCFALLSNVSVSLVVGRSLAVMCHPHLAWYRLRPIGRVALACGYAGLSYLAALVALFALRG